MSPGRPAKLRHVVEVGERVYLRYPLARDREEFVALRRASREHLVPWEPRPPEGFDAFGHDQFDFVYKARKLATQERLLIFAADGAADEGVLVGQASLGVISRGPLQSAYMGYWIGTGHTGRGYMTEAVGLMLRHAFLTVKLHRVEANIQPHNAASIAVAKKNGFRLEGYSPRYLQIDGAWADHERWALTVEDWREEGGARGRRSAV